MKFQMIKQILKYGIAKIISLSKYEKNTQHMLKNFVEDFAKSLEIVDKKVSPAKNARTDVYVCAP